MPAIYSLETIATSATPGTAIITAIEAHLTTHTSWDFVEEYTDTDVYRIWKCNGADNVAGIDFHVALARNSAGTGFSMKVFEGWNATTHRLTNPTPYTISATSSATDWSTGATGTTISSTATQERTLYPSMISPSVAVSQTIHIFVTKSRLAVVNIFSGSSATSWIAGAFPTPTGLSVDSKMKNIALFTPRDSGVLGGNNFSQQSNYPSFTRGWPATYAGVFGAHLVSASNRLEGSINPQGYVDVATGRFRASDVIVYGSSAASSVTGAPPAYRGEFPDAICVRVGNNASVALGDILIGPSSTQYVLLGVTGGHSGGHSTSQGSIFLSTALADV